jgi:hypothetical protein
MLAAALSLWPGPLASPASATAPGANGKIAFVSGRDGNAEIYAMDAGGGNQRRLTIHPAFDSEPDWQATRPGVAGTTRPAPASKDDCKGDGWRRLTNPSFRNQGQCIKSANRE